MTTALISDIHANLVALDTVLADIATHDVDRIICLGDVASAGPQPAAVIDRLIEYNITSVQGNADAWMLNPPRSDTQSRNGLIDRWCAEQLDTHQRDYLTTMPRVSWIEFAPGHRMFAFHGSPTNNRESLLPTTPRDTLHEWLSGYTEAKVFACGHTHTQYVGMFGAAYIVNPGSVGLPRVMGESRGVKPPYAEYALLDFGDDQTNIIMRRVKLDVDAIREAAVASRMPYAEWWGSDWASEDTSP